MRRSVVLALLVVIVLTLAFAIPVCADRPVVTFGLEPTITFPGNTWLCVDAVSFVGSGDYRQQEWLNADGLPERGFQAYSNVKAFFRNEVSGQTLGCNTAGSVHYSVVYNADGSSDWTYTVTGTDAFATLPGIGAVIGYAGQYSYVEHYTNYSNDPAYWAYSQDLSFNGVWGWANTADFCTAMGTSEVSW